MPDELQRLHLTSSKRGETKSNRNPELPVIPCAQERHPHELVPCGVAVLMDAKTALEEPQRVLEVRRRVLQPESACDLHGPTIRSAGRSIYSCSLSLNTPGWSYGHLV